MNHLPALIKAVKENLVVFRYVYATLFPKIYSRIDSDRIREKLSFEFKYHNWWNKKYIQHYQQQSPEQLHCANDLLDGNVEEVATSVTVTNPNEQQPIDPANEKFALLKKTVLSKPKTPKEIISQNADKCRQKRKIELEKKLAENNAQWEIIKNGKKSKRNSIK